MKKSRYQMTNRGRKGKPSWYVEDFFGFEGASVGKYLYSSSVKYCAEGFLKCLRESEKNLIAGDGK